MKEYRILRLKMFRMLECATEAADTKLIREDGDIMVYTVGNEELVETALDEGIIEEYSVDKPVMIYTPDELRGIITSVERITYDRHHVEYVVRTVRGNIYLKTSSLLQINTWRAQAFDNCNMLIQFDMKKAAGEWSALLLQIRAAAVDTVCEDLEADKANIIMTELCKLDIVDARADMDIFDLCVLAENGVYYMPSSLLKTVVEGLCYKFDASLRMALSNYLVGDTKQIRVGGSRISVWQFREWQAIL